MWPPAGRCDTISSDSIREAKESVVEIICGGAAGITGTGFLINHDGYFVTAAHLVGYLANFSAHARCDPLVEVANGGWDAQTFAPTVSLQGFPFDPTRCVADARGDVAACLLNVNPFVDDATKSRVLAASLDINVKREDGTEVAFIGFPLNHTFPLVMRSSIAAYDLDMPSGEPEMIIGTDCWHGSSGSPVFAGGKVVGLVVEKRDSEPGLCFARPSSVIANLLRTHNIGFH